MKIKNQPSYEIKKGIPVPDKASGRPGRYPYGDLEVGDCLEIVVPQGTKSSSLQSRLSSSSRNFGSSLGRKFVTRQLANKTKVAVWRVA